MAKRYIRKLAALFLFMPCLFCLVASGCHAVPIIDAPTELRKVPTPTTIAPDVPPWTRRISFRSHLVAAARWPTGARTITARKGAEIRRTAARSAD